MLVSTANWSSSIGGLLKSINSNGICPKTHYINPYFNGYKLMVCNGICDLFVIRL